MHLQLLITKADKAAFGSVAASWANIEKAWEGGTYDPSKVGSYDWASNGKQTGITHEHTLSASGGTDKFQGYASFGYLNQKGTQPGQAYERYTLKTSFDASPLSFFKMGSSINASYSDRGLWLQLHKISYRFWRPLWSIEKHAAMDCSL